MHQSVKVRKRALNTFSGITSVRPLTTADLASLREPTPVANIARLRESHHEIAYLIALGHSLVEISQMTGYGYNRVHLISKAPNHIELVAKYRAHREAARLEALRDYESRLIANRNKTELITGDYLDSVIESDSPPDLATMRMVNRIGMDRADRTGFGKQSTNLNINANFAAKLEAAIARSSAPPKVISNEP